MLNILYVGWDIESVEILSKGLDAAGHQLVSTYKNDHALFHVNGDVVDFVVLDYDDDCDLDILGILKESRKERPDSPIIILTSLALTKETLRHTVRNLGELRIIRKPFSEQLIMRNIVEMMNASQRIGDKFRVGSTLPRRDRNFVDRRRTDRRDVNLPLEFALSDMSRQIFPEAEGIHFGKVKNVGDGGFLFHSARPFEADMELDTSIRMKERMLRTKVSVIRSLPLDERASHHAVAVKFLN
ncbi:hypothetical protein JYT83_00165 [bacterium AH-315-F18]|nr:hypothetical protein [bacterium AH-315-F18]